MVSNSSNRSEVCNTLQQAATRCNTLQHAATHYNKLQIAATHYSTLLEEVKAEMRDALEHGLAFFKLLIVYACP